MVELIDRAAVNAALEKLDALMQHRAETEDEEFIKVQVGITLASCEIDAMPTIDAAPVVHGDWLRTSPATWECSVCGAPYRGTPERPKSKYCHNCGALMDADAPERAGKVEQDG